MIMIVEFEGRKYRAPKFTRWIARDESGAVYAYDRPPYFRSDFRGSGWVSTGTYPQPIYPIAETHFSTSLMQVKGDL
jgi:hypothetical protein